MQSELGELAKVHLKVTSYGKHKHQEDTSLAWMDELGDVLFSLIALANINGVELETCLKKSILKYKTRIDSYGNAGSEN